MALLVFREYSIFRSRKIHEMKKYTFLSIFRIAVLCCIILTINAYFSYAGKPKVTLKEDADTYILDNGIVTVRVAKASGDLVSLRYKNMEMLATFLTPEGLPDLRRDPPGANPNGLNKGMTDHQYGFWSHDAMGPRGTDPAIAAITIDPKKNGGKRAEVSVKGISNGRKMGTGPGARQDGQFVADIEIRYSLGQGESGVYTYCIFEHRPEYPFTMLGEARFCAKLADFFDWMSVDEKRNFSYPKELKEGDKYIYTVVQSKNPAFGWSSTTKNVGFFIINPSMEYMSGGPTKVEFLGHRDTNPVAAPCVLNYWRSSHYGGAEVNVAAGEEWKKVIGPFLIYVNSGNDPQAIYTDAKSQVKTESDKWPYEWVNGVDYPKSDERNSVKGRLVLNDVLPVPGFTNLLVGLTAPAYFSPQASEQAPVSITDWQRDAKYYQFWTKSDENGIFVIPKVRPGKYTLYAFSDGVLGEFVKADVVVESGKSLDLGDLAWAPVRRGGQVWEIGIPNRNGSEFFKADKYYEPEISLEYAKLFPQDIVYTIGKSDFKKDWFFQHVPHSEDPNAKAEPFFGIRSNGRATPYTVMFDLPAVPEGKATLRLAICGTGVQFIDVSVNGKTAGKIDGLKNDGVISRHGIQGIWYEKEFEFDTGLLQKGTNNIVLTVPDGPVNNGLIYDYLRLEMN